VHPSIASISGQPSQQVATGSPGENQSSQRSAGGWPALGKLASKLGEGDRLVPLDLRKPGIKCRENTRIGKDLSRLLQCLVLVNENQGRLPVRMR
jgi:hypothetical protein